MHACMSPYIYFPLMKWGESSTFIPHTISQKQKEPTTYNQFKHYLRIKYCDHQHVPSHGSLHQMASLREKDALLDHDGSKKRDTVESY